MRTAAQYWVEGCFRASNDIPMSSLLHLDNAHVIAASKNIANWCNTYQECAPDGVDESELKHAMELLLLLKKESNVRSYIACAAGYIFIYAPFTECAKEMLPFAVRSYTSIAEFNRRWLLELLKAKLNDFLQWIYP